MKLFLFHFDEAVLLACWKLTKVKNFNLLYQLSPSENNNLGQKFMICNDKK